MRKSTKNTQINIRLDDDLLLKLRSQADEEVTTTSQLVRKALTYYLRPKAKDQADHVQCLREA